MVQCRWQHGHAIRMFRKQMSGHFEGGKLYKKSKKRETVAYKNKLQVYLPPTISQLLNCLLFLSRLLWPNSLNPFLFRVPLKSWVGELSAVAYLDNNAPAFSLALVVSCPAPSSLLLHLSVVFNFFLTVAILDVWLRKRMNLFRMRNPVHVQWQCALLMRIAWQLHGPHDPIANCHAQGLNKKIISPILSGNGVELD